MSFSHWLVDENRGLSSESPLTSFNNRFLHNDRWYSHVFSPAPGPKLPFYQRDMILLIMAKRYRHGAAGWHVLHLNVADRRQPPVLFCHHSMDHSMNGNCLYDIVYYNVLYHSTSFYISVYIYIYI